METNHCQTCLQLRDEANKVELPGRSRVPFVGVAVQQVRVTSKCRAVFQFPLLSSDFSKALKRCIKRSAACATPPAAISSKLSAKVRSSRAVEVEAFGCFVMTTLVKHVVTRGA